MSNERALITCSEAVQQFEELLRMWGGPLERERWEQLRGRLLVLPAAGASAAAGDTAAGAAAAAAAGDTAAGAAAVSQGDHEAGGGPAPTWDWQEGAERVLGLQSIGRGVRLHGLVLSMGVDCGQHVH